MLDFVKYNANHMHDRAEEFKAAVQRRHDEGWRVYEPLTHIEPTAWSHIWYYRYEGAPR